MGSINLNIDDYNNDELCKLLSISSDYTIDSIDAAKSKLEKLLLQKSDMDNDGKRNISFFLDTVATRLKNSHATWSESVNPIQQHGSNILIENQNSIAGKNSKIVDGRSALSGDTPPGYLNPVNVRTIMQGIAIDSRFRKDYFNTSSSKFTMELPDIQRKCVSLRVATVELPTTYHSVSAAQENNTFIIHCNYQGAQLEGSRKEVTTATATPPQALATGLVNISSVTGVAYPQYNYNCPWIKDSSATYTNTPTTITNTNAVYPYVVKESVFGGCIRMYPVTKDIITGMGALAITGDGFWPPTASTYLGPGGENVGLPGDRIPAWKVTIPDGNYEQRWMKQNQGEFIETVINNAIALAVPGWLDQASGFSTFHPATPQSISSYNSSAYLNPGKDICFTVDRASGRSIFAAPKLKSGDTSYSRFENHGFTIRWLVDNNGNLDIDTSAQLRLGWQLGFRAAQYISGGVQYKWTVKGPVGPTNGEADPKSWQPSAGATISEGVVLISGPRYCYLAINDYKTSTGPAMTVAFANSTLDNNIITKLNLAATMATSQAYQYSDHPGSTTQFDRQREYFGPVDIYRLEFTLYDEVGRVLHLNNMDWSLTLAFEKLYT